MAGQMNLGPSCKYAPTAAWFKSESILQNHFACVISWLGLSPPAWKRLIATMVIHAVNGKTMAMRKTITKASRLVKSSIINHPDHPAAVHSIDRFNKVISMQHVPESIDSQHPVERAGGIQYATGFRDSAQDDVNVRIAHRGSIPDLLVCSGFDGHGQITSLLPSDF
jgi:hypothetical protein